MNSQNLARPQGTLVAPSAALDQMLGIADMKRILNLGNTAIYEGVKSGALPKPYRIFGRRVAWKSSEIQAYIDSLQRVDATAGAAQ